MSHILLDPPRQKMITKLRHIWTLILFTLYILKEVRAKACPPPPKDKTCEEGWTETPSPRMCLRYFNQTGSLFKSADFCKSYGANMVVAHALEMKDDLIEFAKQATYTELWIGLNDINQEEHWTWTSGAQDIEATFENWHAGHPPRNTSLKSGHCAVVDGYAAKWKAVDCKSEHPYICLLRTGVTAKGCEGQYMLQRCIKVVDEKASWEEARRNCSAQKATLLNIVDEPQNTRFTSFLKLRFRFWIGISDNATEKTWLWAPYNYIPEYKSFGKYEGRHNTKENCAFADVYGDWFDTPCSNGQPSTVCQKESPNGPRDVTVTGPEKHEAYIGGTLTVICVAFNAEKGTVEWTANDNNNNNINLRPLFISEVDLVEAVTTDDGCMNKTTSTYTIRVTPDVHEIFMSCFAYKLIKPKKCAYPGAKYSFCDISPIITVIHDGPMTPPEITVTYDEEPAMPGFVKADGTVRVTCTFKPSKESKLVWVVYLENTAVVLNSNDRRVTTVEKKGNVTSNFELQMNSSISGLSIACFGYDVIKHGRTLDCQKWNIHCKRTPELQVHYSALQFNVWIYFILFILLILFLILLLLLFTKVKKQEPEGEEPLKVSRMTFKKSHQEDTKSQSEPPFLGRAESQIWTREIGQKSMIDQSDRTFRSIFGSQMASPDNRQKSMISHSEGPPSSIFGSQKSTLDSGPRSVGGQSELPLRSTTGHNASVGPRNFLSRFVSFSQEKPE